MSIPKTENAPAQKRGERIVYLELLRILCAFCVIVIHVSAQYWSSLPLDSPSWLVCNGYDAFARVGVPVFVMISGMLFLSKEGDIDIGRLYRKNVLKLVAVYWIWCALYRFADCLALLQAHELTVKGCLWQIIQGKYHLWFLPMLTGIYLIVPVLKVFVDHCSKKQIEYFLLLFFVMQIGGQTLNALFLSEMVDNLIYLVSVELAQSYVGYFILGYYLFRYPPSVRWTHRFYLLGAAGMVSGVVISALLSLQRGEGQSAVFDSYSVFTFLGCIAVFLLFQQEVGKRTFSSGAKRLIREISDDTLGVYVIHVGILDVLMILGFDSMSFNNIIGIPLLALCCFIISSVIAALLRRIPVVGRYIC